MENSVSEQSSHKGIFFFLPLIKLIKLLEVGKQLMYLFFFCHEKIKAEF